MSSRFSILAALVCALGLAGCGGSRETGNGLTPATAPHGAVRSDAQTGVVVPMTFTVTIPTPAPPLARRHMPAARLHQLFVASSTQSIQFQIYKANAAHIAGNLLSTQV